MATTVYTVYGRPSSLNAIKVFVMIEECEGVECDLVHASGWLAPGANVYSYHAGETYDDRKWEKLVDSQAYRDLNPNPTVPTMLLPEEAGGGALFESNVIVRYLARKHAPALLGDAGTPEAAARAEVWMDWQTAGSWRNHAKGGGGKGASSVAVLHDNVVRLPPDRRAACGAILDAAVAAAEALGLLEAQLGKAPFLGGERFTVADIPMGTMVARFKVSLEKAVEIHGAASFDLARLPPTPNIDRWWAALQERPGFFRGCVIPERMHAGLPVAAELPAWYKAYNRRYGLP